jgi:hypothetical protein
MVCRPSVAKHIPVCVEGVPADCRKDGMLAQLTSITLDPSPPRDTAPAVRVDHRSEVIAYGIAISHMDWNALSDREKGRKAKLGHTLKIALRVPTDVLVHEHVYGLRHPRTLVNELRRRPRHPRPGSDRDLRRGLSPRFPEHSRHESGVKDARAPDVRWASLVERSERVGDAFE